MSATDATPTKAYSTRETDYAPGETVARTWSKTSVVNALQDYNDAIEECCLTDYDRWEREGPQGLRKEKELPGAVAPEAVVEKVSRWDDVKAYVTELRDDGTQVLRIRVGNIRTSTTRYRVVFDASVVRWDV